MKTLASERSVRMKKKRPPSGGLSSCTVKRNNQKLRFTSKYGK
jgi:hypothetical protein